MNMISVGVIGAAGYTGGELLRLLLNHPHVSVAFAQSRSQAGKYIWQVHGDLLGESMLQFTHEAEQEVDVIFLCLAHGESAAYFARHSFPDNTKIIDLSQDFRDESAGFVYGLTEWNRDRISAATRVANPGCFATAIQLALLPLVQQDAVKSDLHVSATTGSTGAGQSLSDTAHYSWRTNNLSVYKAFSHQHLHEIKRSISRVNHSFSHVVNFIPQRGPFSRGIFSVMTLETDKTAETCREIFDTQYRESRFVHFSEEPVDLKKVVNTNKCHISIEKQGKQLMVISAIDNLLKGASGQAIQNMNLMCGFPEEAGLRLKAMAF